MFRHLDHVVQLVGFDHACLGLDVVFETEPLNQFMRARPEEWPDAAWPDWPGVRYAQPEQLVELTILMLDAGYGDTAIRGILGENLLRVCSTVWH